MGEICSKLKINTSVINVVLVSLLLTLEKFHTFQHEVYGDNSTENWNWVIVILKIMINHVSSIRKNANFYFTNCWYNFYNFNSYQKLRTQLFRSIYSICSKIAVKTPEWYNKHCSECLHVTWPHIKIKNLLLFNATFLHPLKPSDKLMNIFRGYTNATSPS